MATETGCVDTSNGKPEVNHCGSDVVGCVTSDGKPRVTISSTNYEGCWTSDGKPQWTNLPNCENLPCFDLRDDVCDSENWYSADSILMGFGSVWVEDYLDGLCYPFGGLDGIYEVPQFDTTGMDPPWDPSVYFFNQFEGEFYPYDNCTSVNFYLRYICNDSVVPTRLEIYAYCAIAVAVCDIGEEACEDIEFLTEQCYGTPSNCDPNSEMIFTGYTDMLYTELTDQNDICEFMRNPSGQWTVNVAMSNSVCGEWCSNSVALYFGVDF